jgi:hypothetical protein
MYLTQSIGNFGSQLLFCVGLSQSISELFIHRTCPAQSNPLQIRTFDAFSSIVSISTVLPEWSPEITVACINYF